MSIPIIAKGLLTFVLPPSLYNRGLGRTRSARYCYSVYLRHLVMLHSAGCNTGPRVVAEIGPGASVGVGLAALAAGAERYYGLEIKDYGIGPERAELFDDLVSLLRNRAPVPDENELPNIKPALENLAFPEYILTHERLSRALAPERIGRLRAAVAGDSAANGDPPLAYAAPWSHESVRRDGEVDWILSQAVMEHVDDLAETYRACWHWLAPGGCMSHQIDYKCHGTAPAWNGHWAYSDVTWRMVRGGRGFLINRQPHSAHIACQRQAGFEILLDRPVTRTDGLPRERLAPRYDTLDDDDVATAGAFILARKPAKSAGRATL